MRRILLLCTLIFIPINVFSQVLKPNIALADKAGIYVGYQRVGYTADFKTLPGVFGCGTGYSEGSGNGYYFGGLYQMPLTNMLAFQIRGGYSAMPGTMTRTEEIGNAYNPQLQVVIAQSEHILNANLGVLALEPRLVVAPFSFPLAFHVGLEAGALLLKSYDQIEQLKTPEGVAFKDNGLRTRNATNGTIPETNTLQFGALGAVSYDLPVGQQFILSPEIAYVYGLTDVLKDYSWSTQNLRAGISLSYLLKTPANLPAENTTNSPDIARLTIKGRVIDSLGNPINALIKVQDLTTGELLGQYATVNGTYEFTATPGRHYGFYAEKAGYYPTARNLETQPITATTELRADDIVLYKIEELQEEEIPVIARNVFFDYNSDVILPKSYYELNRVVEILKKRPDLRMLIAGHTSTDGTVEYNQGLSERRAASVRAYLIAGGINENNLTTVGYGGRNPIADNNNEAGRKLNRRVEFIFLK